MTKEIMMTNDEVAGDHRAIVSSFEFRHSFVMGHSL